MVATAIAIVAFVSVGLTAPAGSPFTIEVEPVFMRLDAAALTDSNPHAFAVKVHIKAGTLHLHYKYGRRFR